MKAHFLLLLLLGCSLNMQSMEICENNPLLKTIDNNPDSLSSRVFQDPSQENWVTGEMYELNLHHKNWDRITNIPLPVTTLSYADITSVILNHNNLTELPPTTLQALVNLKKISVTHNKLTSVDIGEWFHTFRYIKDLNFSSNAIKLLTWSAHTKWHPSWYPKDHTYKLILPRLDFRNNQPICNETTKTWLTTCYKEQLQKAYETIYPYNINYGCFGCIAGALSVTFPMIAIKFIFGISPLSCLAIPIGGVIGGGCIAPWCIKDNYNLSMEKNIANISIPIYIDSLNENTQKAYELSFSYQSNDEEEDQSTIYVDPTLCADYDNVACCYCDNY